MPRFGLRPSHVAAAVTAVPLTPEAATTLDLGWSSSFSNDQLRRHVERYAGLSWYVPATGEYLIGGPWRHRREIAVIQELRSRLAADRLVAAFTGACAAGGMRLAVLVDQHETRSESFYRHIGFESVQEIIVYELPRLPKNLPESWRLRFQPVPLAMADDLVRLDHAAFPWLWWNSVAEFDFYARLPGVELSIGRADDDSAAAYVGITSYRGWGHLDRIAVAPDHQGQGYGLEALNFAISRLATLGAKRIGLSTQADNSRSRHLYERYGFRRAQSHDYMIYGKWLDDPDAAANDQLVD